MACQVRYLNSAGIMRREIPGIDALANAFPKEWLLYASLNCYPRAQDPMEIDALVVIDDRILLLELKDWNGKLTQRGDQWFIKGQSRGRSPVIVAEEKAKKLKTVIKNEIPYLKNVYVERRVVLTASATRDEIAENEKKYVWTIGEACSIADPKKRAALLGPDKSGALKIYQFEKDLDRVTNNPKLFQPSEAQWSGYRISEANVVDHPQGVWSEHRAEHCRESRIKALLRIWSFDRLPPGLNSPDRRKLITERETKAFAHLTDLECPLIERNALLTDVGPYSDEILTNHFQVRSLQADWLTWDRYLEKNREELDAEDRIALSTTLLSHVAALHRCSVAHRDLGPRSIWVGSPAKMAINGFMCCQLPGEESVEDWLPVLKGYASLIPDDQSKAKKTSGKQRDVYLAGLLVASALNADIADFSNNSGEVRLHSDFQNVYDWLKKSLAADSSSRFLDAVQMADEFSALTESFGSLKIDQKLLDQYETPVIPFVEWPLKQSYANDSRRSVYLSSLNNGDEVVVKIWHGMHRNVSVATDLSLLRLLQSGSRVLASPAPGLPRFIRVGLSPVGPFVVYRHEKGKPVDLVGPLGASDVLLISQKIIRSVMSLHDLGCDHGDIAAKNIYYDASSREICILDAFDISPIGDGMIRTPSNCPNNWEKLSQQSLDRYATVKVIVDLLQATGDKVLGFLIHELEKELLRPAIETLEVALSLITETATFLEKPTIPLFKITHPNGGNIQFNPDANGYYISRRQVKDGSSIFVITALDHELVLSTRQNVLVSSTFKQTKFNSLLLTNNVGRLLEINISVSSGPGNGFLELLDYLQASYPSLQGENQPNEEKSQSCLNVPRHWERTLELEINDRVEVEILDDLGFATGVSAYLYKNTGKIFDFDPESPIDVYTIQNKKVGEVEHSLSVANINTLAIRNQSRRLRQGDIVYLVDRREQTSIDRRNKAVRKILAHQAAIPNLIDFFCLDAEMGPVDYGTQISDQSIKAYRLNQSQEEAFRNLIRFGPVGLLQGPPGTGKTRFIASLVHWLMTEGGANRILVASQSHEAVNNAIEALVKLYKDCGKKPNLLRIGSKGITDKIRPYHSAELRDRYRIRFEASLKHRVSTLATEKGIPRQFTLDVLKVDEDLGALARHCNRLIQLTESSSEITITERDRLGTELKRAQSAFRKAAAQTANLDVDVSQPLQELELAFNQVLTKNPKSSLADLATVRQIIELAKDWCNSLGSRSRNFDEFLAKTRSIVTATCVGVGETKIRIDASNFDWVIVDEAARCTSSELAVPIQLGRRILLVGDHLQLMPMFKRTLADRLVEEFPNSTRDELLSSDFERSFLSGYGTKVGMRLTEQYRMHKDICRLVSECFYETNHVKLTTSEMRQPSLVIPSDVTTALSMPICWIDTTDSADSIETQLSSSTTFHNNAEIDAIIRLLDRVSVHTEMVEALKKCEEESPIGIICMYSGQKRRLELACARHSWEPRFRKLIRIDTVDAYQGKENSIVIVSLVRSNPDKITGHVRSENRCNVAMSRAKERLIIVGSRAMWEAVNSSEPMNRALKYVQSNVESGFIISTESI